MCNFVVFSRLCIISAAKAVLLNSATFFLHDMTKFIFPTTVT